MSYFGVPKPKRHPQVDPSEFDDPFFTGTQRPSRPNVYMELGDSQRETEEPKPRTLTELSPAEQLDILDKLYARVIDNPEIELSQDEASLVYSVDKDLANEALSTLTEGIKKRRGFHEGMNDDEIKHLRDFEQVKSLIIERLRSEKNVIQTSKALSQIMEGLGVEGYKPKAYVYILKEKMKDWEERGVFDYLTIELIRNNNRHNIVPVPNAEFDYEQIISLADSFIEQHLTEIEYKIKIKAEQLCSQFSPTELSGLVTNPEQPLRLRLLPSKPNLEFAEYKGGPEAESGNTQKMLKILAQIRGMRPNLDVGVPSILEGVALVFTLRSLGQLTDSRNAVTDKVALFNETLVRAFNLQPRSNDNFHQELFTFIDSKGNLRLTTTLHTYCLGARLSIG